MPRPPSTAIPPTPPVRGLAASLLIHVDTAEALQGASPKSPNLAATCDRLGVGLCEKTMNSEDVVPPLAANMSAAFKKVRGAIGGANDPDLADLIVARIVELAKDGVYDIEELSSRTLSSLKASG
jgi:hypothetical protein